MRIREMTFMRIDLLCSGSKGNACLIREGQSQILIDCGSTQRYLKKAFQEVEASIDNCQGVLITHTHKDHISRIKDVKHIPLYSYCELDPDFNQTIVEPLSTFDIGTFHIQVIRLSHDAPKTVGYIIEGEKEKLVYVTDTGYIPNNEKALLSNADYYVFESNHDVAQLMKTNRPMFLKQRILGDSGHLNNEDASNNLCQLVNGKTKEIVLAHLSEEANHPEIALDTLKQTFHKKDLPLHSIHMRAAKQFEVLTIHSND